MLTVTGPLSFGNVHFFVFYTFGIAFHVTVTGEDRNFKFGTDVDRNKS